MAPRHGRLRALLAAGLLCGAARGTSVLLQQPILTPLSIGASRNLTLGTAVALDGDLAIIGEPFVYDSIINPADVSGAATSYVGQAQVLRRDPVSLEWHVEASLKPPLLGPDDTAPPGFGWVADMHLGRAVVGYLPVASSSYNASQPGTAEGSVSAFQLDAATGEWRQEAVLKASDARDLDLFGSSVALQGDRLLVGAPGANAVYYFRYAGSGWAEAQKLGIPGTFALGYAVALDGDLAVATDTLSPGTAVVFRHKNGAWESEVALRPILNGAANSGLCCYAASIRAAEETVAFTSTLDAANRGAVHFYQNENRFTASPASWVPDALLQPKAPSDSEFFGVSTALHGGVLAVGAYGTQVSPTNLGSVYLFRRDELNGRWDETVNVVATGGGAFAAFGYGVAIDREGTQMIAGVANADERSPAGAFVFDVPSPAPSPPEQLPRTIREYGRFGASVDIKGNRAIVGSFHAAEAYIYERSDSTSAWRLAETVTESDPDGSVSNFGAAVAIDGDFAAVGAHNKDAARGAAYVFRRDAATGAWAFSQKLFPSKGASFDTFGRALALSGAQLLVGAPERNKQEPFTADAGAAFLFTYEGGAWEEGPTLESNSTEVNAAFGAAVALSEAEGILAVGAAGDESGGAGFAGKAYVFRRAEDGAWALDAALEMPSPKHRDAFGSCVAVGGGRVLVGAAGRDRSDPSVSNAGAALVFARNESGWRAEATLLAPVAQSSDFGGACAIGDTVAAVGARLSGSGDEGAVHVYRRGAAGNEWSFQATVEAPNAQPFAYFGASVALSRRGAEMAVGAEFEDLSGFSNAGNAVVFDTLAAIDGASAAPPTEPPTRSPTDSPTQPPTLEASAAPSGTAAPTEALEPLVAVRGPSRVSQCAGQPAEVVIEASERRGLPPSGLSWSWSVYNYGSPVAPELEAIADAERGAALRVPRRLVQPGDELLVIVSAAFGGQSDTAYWDLIGVEADHFSLRAVDATLPSAAIAPADALQLSAELLEECDSPVARVDLLLNGASYALEGDGELRTATLPPYSLSPDDYFGAFYAYNGAGDRVAEAEFGFSVAAEPVVPVVIGCNATLTVDGGAIRVDASQSFDPNVGYRTQAARDAVNVSLGAFSQDAACGATVDTLSFSGEALRLDPRPSYAGCTFTLSLDLRDALGALASTHTCSLSLLAEPTPLPRILVAFGGTKVDPQRSLTVPATVESYAPDVVWQWTLLETGAPQGDAVAAGAANASYFSQGPAAPADLVLPPLSLRPGAQYTLTLRAAFVPPFVAPDGTLRSGADEAQMSVLLTANAPPAGGALSVFPEEGSFSTIFDLQTSGWSDPDLPLRFTFVALPQQGQPASILNPSSPSATSLQARLPAGVEANAFALDLEVVAADAFGAEASAAERAVVLPGATPEESIDGALAIISEVSGLEDADTVIQALLSASAAASAGVQDAGGALSAAAEASLAQVSSRSVEVLSASARQGFLSQTALEAQCVAALRVVNQRAGVAQVAAFPNAQFVDGTLRAAQALVENARGALGLDPEPLSLEAMDALAGSVSRAIAFEDVNSGGSPVPWAQLLQAAQQVRAAESSPLSGAETTITPWPRAFLTARSVDLLSGDISVARDDGQPVTTNELLFAYDLPAALAQQLGARGTVYVSAAAATASAYDRAFDAQGDARFVATGVQRLALVLPPGAGAAGAFEERIRFSQGLGDAFSRTCDEFNALRGVEEAPLRVCFEENGVQCSTYSAALRDFVALPECAVEYVEDASGETPGSVQCDCLLSQAAASRRLQEGEPGEQEETVEFDFGTLFERSADVFRSNLLSVGEGNAPEVVTVFIVLLLLALLCLAYRAHALDEEDAAPARRTARRNESSLKDWLDRHGIAPELGDKLRTGRVDSLRSLGLLKAHAETSRRPSLRDLEAIGGDLALQRDEISSLRSALSSAGDAPKEGPPPPEEEAKAEPEEPADLAQRSWTYLSTSLAGASRALFGAPATAPPPPPPPRPTAPEDSDAEDGGSAGESGLAPRDPEAKDGPAEARSGPPETKSGAEAAENAEATENGAAAAENGAAAAENGASATENGAAEADGKGAGGGAGAELEVKDARWTLPRRLSSLSFGSIPSLKSPKEPPPSDEKDEGAEGLADADELWFGLLITKPAALLRYRERPLLSQAYEAVLEGHHWYAALSLRAGSAPTRLVRVASLTAELFGLLLITAIVFQVLYASDAECGELSNRFSCEERSSLVNEDENRCFWGADGCQAVRPELSVRNVVIAVAFSLFFLAPFSLILGFSVDYGLSGDPNVADDYFDEVRRSEEASLRRNRDAKAEAWAEEELKLLRDNPDLRPSAYKGGRAHVEWALRQRVRACAYEAADLEASLAPQHTALERQLAAKQITDADFREQVRLRKVGVVKIAIRDTLPFLKRRVFKKYARVAEDAEARRDGKSEALLLRRRVAFGALAAWVLFCFVYLCAFSANVPAEVSEAWALSFAIGEVTNVLLLMPLRIIVLAVALPSLVRQDVSLDKVEVSVPHFSAACIFSRKCEGLVPKLAELLDHRFSEAAAAAAQTKERETPEGETLLRRTMAAGGAAGPRAAPPAARKADEGGWSTQRQFSAYLRQDNSHQKQLLRRKSLQTSELPGIFDAVDEAIADGEDAALLRQPSSDEELGQSLASTRRLSSEESGGEHQNGYWVLNSPYAVVGKLLRSRPCAIKWITHCCLCIFAFVALAPEPLQEMVLEEGLPMGFAFFVLADLSLGIDDDFGELVVHGIFALLIVVALLAMAVSVHMNIVWNLEKVQNKRDGAGSGSAADGGGPSGEERGEGADSSGSSSSSGGSDGSERGGQRAEGAEGEAKGAE